MSTLSTTRRRTLRALTGLLAALPSLLIWVIAVPLLDISLTFTDMKDQTQEVVPGAIVLFGLVPGLAGWALLAILERLAPRRGKTIWTVVAVALLALSMVPLIPLSAGAAIALGLMHVATAAVIIGVMRQTSLAPATA